MEHEIFDVLTKFQSFGLFVGQGGVSHKRIKANVTCSDPEFLCGGGRGGPGLTARKQPYPFLMRMGFLVCVVFLLTYLKG